MLVDQIETVGAFGDEVGRADLADEAQERNGFNGWLGNWWLGDWWLGDW